MCIQNKQEATLSLFDYLCNTKDKGLLFSLLSYFCNLEIWVFKSNRGVFFNLLVINKYYTPKIFFTTNSIKTSVKGSFSSVKWFFLVSIANYIKLL